jgi:hypothetical protein
MINIKEAARLAMDFVKEIYPEDVMSGATVEEIVLDEAGETWLVTVGLLPGQPTLLSDRMSTGHATREFKVIQIRREDGEALGMTTKR